MNRRNFFKWTGLGGLSAFFAGGGAFAAWNPRNYYYRGPKTDHFNGEIFYNPGGYAPKQFLNLLKWQLGTEKAKWPETWPSPFDRSKPEARVEGEEISITMVGHATVLIQAAGLNLLTDPVYVDRASPVQFLGPRRVNPPGVQFNDLPDIDYVLLSHNHYDHLDLATLERLSREHGATIITPLGNDTIVKEKAPDANFIVGDWYDVVELKNGVRLHFEPCHHWSARGLKDRRMALWSAFMIETPSHKLYHVGDTGFHDGINYRELHEKHGAMDVAILPIGAYEPRWFMKHQHQNPDEAVQGHKLIQATTTIGHHWGTFQLTNEAIDDPLNALVEAREKHAVADDAFVALRPGEAWRMNRETG